MLSAVNAVEYHNDDRLEAALSAILNIKLNRSKRETLITSACTRYTLSDEMRDNLAYDHVLLRKNYLDEDRDCGDPDSVWINDYKSRLSDEDSSIIDDQTDV